jgi:hypothetical protein
LPNCSGRLLARLRDDWVVVVVLAGCRIDRTFQGRSGAKTLSEHSFGGINRMPNDSRNTSRSIRYVCGGHLWNALAGSVRDWLGRLFE